MHETCILTFRGVYSDEVTYIKHAYIQSEKVRSEVTYMKNAYI